MRVAAQLALVLALLAAAGVAAADTGDIDIEIPTLVLDDGVADGVEDALEVDESLLVRSAAKRLTTVLESSAIVTVLSREDLQARGYRQLADMLDDIPGFEGWRAQMMWGRRLPLARGQARTILVLWNGVPMNSPHSNVQHMWVDLPMDVVRRVEVVSGPGGVLWGANAFLGVVNVVTQRGDPSEPRSEAKVVAGGGPGQQDAYGASATVRESLLDGDLRLFLNATLWTSRDAALEVPYDLYFTPFPGSPDGTITAKDSAGALRTGRDFCLPITANADYQLGEGQLGFDVLWNGKCDQKEEIEPRGIRTDVFYDPQTMDTTPGIPSNRTYQSTALQLRYERTVGAHQLLSRAYYLGYRNDFDTEILAPPGQFGPEAIIAHQEYDGTNVLLNNGTYRIGLVAETDLEFEDQSTVAGIETLMEGRRPWVVTGAGTDVITILEDGELLGIRKRYVMGAFGNHRVRLGRLAIEGGARVQGAVGDEDVAYDALVLPGGALVWNPAGRTYLKLNYAEGFRPVHLSATAVSDDSTATTYFGKAGELRPERVRSAEAEVSSVVLEGVRRVRRVHLRLGYQWSVVTDVILGRTGDLRNAGVRNIHTMEARADIAFHGGHRVVLAGHMFAGEDSETGPIRQVGNWKLHAASDVAFDEHIRGMIVATILGPREDLNRIPLPTDTPGLDYVMPVGAAVVDRTPPQALVRAGLRAVELVDDRFDVGVFVENVFDARPPVPDVDFDKREAPYTQSIPGVSMYATLTGRL